MLVRLASADAFFTAFPHPTTIFDSAAFIALNAHKTLAVRHFIGYDEKERPRMGITLGYDGKEWHAPFSAPFALPACNELQSPERVYDFFSELSDTLDAPVNITLPPAFYASQAISAYSIVLGNMARRQFNDYNYHYPLDFAMDFEGHLDRSARKNYRRAIMAGFQWVEEAPLERAYAVIAANRQSHGYPLAMTLEQVRETIEPEGPVKAHCFLLTLDDKDVAAALVYEVTPTIAQVIYWGDAPGYSEQRPMNLLPKLLFSWAQRRGYRIIDIGPSSKHGVPSTGLCRFKAALGCQLTPKTTYTL